VGANFNAWITDEEINELVESGRAERFDDRIKVKGKAAEDLHSSLDPNRTMEHEHAPSRTHLQANQTANEVLDLNSETNDGDAKNSESNNVEHSSNEVGSDSHSTPRSEGSDYDGSSSGSNSYLDDFHSYEYGPEGCTMATFC
jgi:hypothetical protein